MRLLTLLAALGALLISCLASAATPQSGWWWNPAEGGRGYFIEVNASGAVFAGSYLYDDSGNPLWYVTGPGATTSSGFTGILGAYSGGQTLTGAYVLPAGPTSAGNVSFDFSDDTHGTLTWPGGTVPLTRYEINPATHSLSAAPNSFQPETGWWWNAAEGGRGFSLEIQGDDLFISGFMYDGSGNPVWYVSAGKMSSPTVYQGTWMQYWNGQSMGGDFRMATVKNSNVGALAISFTSTTTAILYLPDGRTLPITRYQFVAPTTPTPQPTPMPTLNVTVAYQVDSAHSGRASFGQAIKFPSAPAWSIDFGNEIAYPLIAEDKVFVLTKGAVSGSNPAYGGNRLYALDVRTGALVWGPIGIQGSIYAVSQHAYDRGRIFVMNYDGKLRAFNSSTGALLWTDNLAGVVLDNQSIDGSSELLYVASIFFTAPPTATNGLVYVSGAGVGGILFAIDGATGNVIWKAPLRGGDHSSAAVSNEGVFVSYPCNVQKRDPATGALLWYYDGSCSGGGGRTPAYADGRLYVRDWEMPLAAPGLIFNTTTGQHVGYFPTRVSATPIPTAPMPAIGQSMGYFVYGSPTGCCTAGTGAILAGINLNSGLQTWQFIGDGNIAMAPLLIDDYVFAASQSGKVYALGARSGALAWTGEAGSTLFGTDEHDAEMLTGMAVGSGHLVVPAGNRITAWRMLP